MLLNRLLLSKFNFKNTKSKSRFTAAFFVNGIKQKIPLEAGFIVGLLGLEPRKTAPKTVVLPLHHRPISLLRVQIYNKFYFTQTII